MQLINEKGKFFGRINIVDFAFLLLITLIITTLYIYTHTPPRVKEHKEVIFQMYFIDVPYAVGQDLFVPGNEFIATFEKDDHATIISAKRVDSLTLNQNIVINETNFIYLDDTIAFQNVIDYNGLQTDYLVTINGSLQIDAEGDYTFNDQNVGPGNILYLQLNNSYLRGFVWRMDYNYTEELTNITVALKKIIGLDYIYVGDPVFVNNQKAGEIITITQPSPNYYEVIITLLVGAYDGNYFINEYPLLPSQPFTFSTATDTFEGNIIEVS